MKRGVVAITLVLSAVFAALSFSACNNTDIFKSLVPPTESEKAFETLAAELPGDDRNNDNVYSDPAETRLTVQQGAQVLSDYLTDADAGDIEYRNTVRVYDTEYSDELTYYWYDVGTGDARGSYYVRVSDIVRDLYDADEFGFRYFDPNKKDYTPAKAGSKLLEFLGSSAGTTVEYLTTVTVTDMDYAGDMDYYKLDVKY